MCNRSVSLYFSFLFLHARACIKCQFQITIPLDLERGEKMRGCVSVFWMDIYMHIHKCLAQITYFFAIRISHNNTINNRRFPCLSMSILRANCIHLQEFDRQAVLYNSSCGKYNRNKQCLKGQRMMQDKDRTIASVIILSTNKITS